MIPVDKHDEASIELLQLASDEDVIDNAEQLLTWLKDTNWPVFGGIVKRLSPLGEHLVPQITRIIESSDSIWKANIIGHLIPTFSPIAQQRYTESLKIILTKYDENDLREGAIDFVEIQLSNTKKNV